MSISIALASLGIVSSAFGMGLVAIFNHFSPDPKAIKKGKPK